MSCGVDLGIAYGYCLNILHSFEFPGESGFKKMQSIIEYFRNNQVNKINMGRTKITP